MINVSSATQSAPAKREALRRLSFVSVWHALVDEFLHVGNLLVLTFCRALCHQLLVETHLLKFIVGAVFVSLDRLVVQMQSIGTNGVQELACMRDHDQGVGPAPKQSCSQ